MLRNLPRGFESLCFHDIFFEEGLNWTEEFALFCDWASNLQRFSVSVLPCDFIYSLAKTDFSPFGLDFALTSFNFFNDSRHHLRIISRNTKMNLHCFIQEPRIRKNEEGAAALIQSWPKIFEIPPSLRSLGIHFALKEIPKNFFDWGKFDQLETLSLSGKINLLRDGDLIRMARCTPNLRRLNLSRLAKSISFDWIYLPRFWKRLEQLTLLSSCITGLNLIQLAMENVNLRKIYLEHCSRLDSRLKPFCRTESVVELVTACKNLQEFSAMFCKFDLSDEGLRRIVDHAKLKIFAVSSKNCAISHYAIESLRNRFSVCEWNGIVRRAQDGSGYFIERCVRLSKTRSHSKNSSNFNCCEICNYELFN